MPSQQSSLSGTRMILACHEAIAATEVASLAPSNMPQPWMQAYSVPERLTPWRKTVLPEELIRWLPQTERPAVGAQYAELAVALTPPTTNPTARRIARKTATSLLGLCATWSTTFYRCFRSLTRESAAP